MRTTLHSILLLAFLVTGPALLHGQEIRVDADFRDVPFPEFSQRIEAQYDIHIFYLDSWVRGIRVTASGRDLPLEGILDRTLHPAGIFYYMDQGGNIYLSPDGPLIAELPEYGSREREKPAGGDRESQVPGETQARDYIRGHRNGQVETLVVGQAGANASARGVVVNGRITDMDSGEPLVGATLYLEELGRGAATDLDGRFSIILPPGKHRASFKSMGMQGREYLLDVHSDGHVNIGMHRALISISEVVVKADRYDHVRGSQMGFERLNYKTTKEVPVVLGEKDLLKVAQMLPGVQSVGEASAGFNVRGGSADQNMIYVNRVPVYNSSHLFGFFSSFSSDIVRDFALYKSNIPAMYGGRLSSIFNITTRQGNMKQLGARGGISPVTGHLAVEGPIRKNHSAFVLSARSTYSDWILGRLEDPELRNSNASFRDFSGTLTFSPGEKSTIRAFGYYSNDAFSLGSTNDYDYSNGGASLGLKHRFSSRLTGDMTMVFGQYSFGTVNRELESESYQHNYRIDHYELRSDLSWLSLGKHRLSYGANAIVYDLHRGLVEPYGDNSLRYPVDLGRENGVEVAAYLADEISLGRRITANIGYRHSAFTGNGRSYHGPEPRVSLTWLTGRNNSIKLSYNRLNQYILMLSSTFSISPTDQWKLADATLRPPVVDQYSLGYYRELPELGIRASAEVYYKDYDHVLEYRDGADFINNPDVGEQVLQGEQEAWGLEMMLRKQAGKLSGWLSYTYSRSTMIFRSSIPGEAINGGRSYPSNYDRPHNLNLVSNYRLNRRLSISASLVYITGRPITYPVSIYYRDGIQYLEYSDRNQYRIPDYFRSDLSINLEGNLKRRKLAHSFWMLSVYNLTGRHNPYSIYFRNEGGQIQGYKLSIFGRPVITLSWNFKFGNYATE